MGTVAATLGAAVILVNSSWGLPKRSPHSIARLEGALLRYVDGSNRVVRGRDLWRENGAVIVAVRRSG